MAGLDVTTKIGCSVRCRFCPQDTLIERYAATSDVFYLSLDTFKTCLDKVPRDVSIWFAGMCEPWLNPEATDMLLYAHETGHGVNVSTTLVKLELSDVERIEHIPFETFRVHLACADEGLEKIPVDDRYLAVLERIKASKINAVFHHHGSQPHEKVVPVLDLVRRETSSTRASNDVEWKDKGVPKRKTGVLECGVGLEFNELVPNGDVYVCCHDYGLEHRLGSLLHESYEDLFQSEGFRRVQAGLKDPSLDILCRNCQDARSASVTAKGMRKFGKLSYYAERGYAYLTREKLVLPA